MLIGFDLLLVLVVGLVLYSVSARDPQAPPDVFDALQLLLVVSALVVDAVALAAIAARISEFGFTPEPRGRARREPHSAGQPRVVGVALRRASCAARSSFARLERWQIAYLPVYSVVGGVRRRRLSAAVRLPLIWIPSRQSGQLSSRSDSGD